MNFYYKNLGCNEAEAWVEDYCPKKGDIVVVATSKLMMAGTKCLIDVIETKPEYRKKGYATKIVNELLTKFEVEPIGVVPESQGFWDKFGMVDGLGAIDEDVWE